MVSPELLRRYKFFGGLEDNQLKLLAIAAEEVTLESGQYFFREGEDLNTLYLVIEGRIEITYNLPELGSRAIIPAPTARTREVVLSTVNAGDIFAWSSLVPPYQATSNGKAAGQCQAVAIDCQELRKAFEEDPHFGYTMMVKIAQVARDRLQDLHYESLAHA